MPSFEEDNEFDPTANEILVDTGNLRERYPHASAFLAASRGKEQNQRLAKAGLCLAAVILGNKVAATTTLVMRPTPEVHALLVILEDEENGILPEGAHDLALDDIAAGTFDKNWSTYLASNQE